MNENNRFWKGFFSGFLTTMVIVIIVGAGAGFIWVGRGISSGPYSPSNYKKYSLKTILVQGDYEKTELDQEKIQYKLQFLQNMIDKYYLFEQDPTAAEEMTYTGFVAGLKDPYSAYYSVEEYTSMRESSSGTYYGIGVQVTQSVKTGEITITRVFSGSPAFEAGLLPEDRFLKVAGNEVTGMDLSAVVALLKGGEGTEVEVEVYRPGLNDIITFSVERRQVEVDTVLHEMMEGKIGYIQLMEFDEVTYEQFMLAYQELEAQGMEALVIDLRGNPGGLINSATDILNELLPEGVIVYTKLKSGDGDTYYSDDKKEITIPLSVLVNESSASASELFVSAVKDYGKGTIVGTTTFGKGIMQHLVPLGDNTALKLTVGNFYTKSGYLIHENGVEPDVAVELNEELKTMVEIPKDQDNQLQKAIEVLNSELGR